MKSKHKLRAGAVFILIAVSISIPAQDKPGPALVGDLCTKCHNLDEVVRLRQGNRTQRGEVIGHELAVEQEIARLAHGGHQPGECDLARIAAAAEHAFPAEDPVEGNAV